MKKFISLALSYCDNLTDIYCEAETQPEGWSNDWIYCCNATVHGDINRQMTILQTPKILQSLTKKMA